jgi:hypothetical protein
LRADINNSSSNRFTTIYKQVHEHHLSFDSIANRTQRIAVLEKDSSSIRGEGRGPIQIQSNALSALETMGFKVAEISYESWLHLRAYR